MKNRVVCRQCAVPFASDEEAGVHLRCPNCGERLDRRTDSDAEIARRRQREYERETRPVVERYAEDGTVVTVDGEQPPEVVFEACHRAVENRR